MHNIIISNILKYIRLILYIINILIIYTIIFYQKYISIFLGKNCRYTITCSEYMINSLKLYGILKGILFSIIRIIKCNPFIKINNE